MPLYFAPKKCYISNKDGLIYSFIHLIDDFVISLELPRLSTVLHYSLYFDFKIMLQDFEFWSVRSKWAKTN